MSEDRPQPPVPAEWRSRLLELPRLNKRIILVALDFLLLTLALWISISIRYNAAYVPSNWYTALVLFSGPFLTVMTFAVSGLYRFVTRYLGYRGHTRIIGCIWLSVLIWSLVVLMSGQLGIPRSVVLGYGVLATLLIAGSREVAAMILESAGIRLSELPANIERTPVIIFGAGHLGVQLLEALRRGYNRTAVAFIDTEPSLWRQYVSGLKVHHPDKLPMLIDRHQVKEILVAHAGRPAARAAAHPQGSAGPAGRGEGAAGGGGHRLRPRERHRPAPRRGQRPSRPRQGSAQCRSAGAQVARQVHPHHRRRRLHRLRAGPSAPEAGSAPHRAARYLRGRALPDRGRDHRV